MTGGPTEAERALQSLGWKPEPGERVWVYHPKIGLQFWRYGIVLEATRDQLWLVRLGTAGPFLRVGAGSLLPRRSGQ